MPDPTLTTRLDLCVKCGMPMESLEKAGFTRDGDDRFWWWLRGDFLIHNDTDPPLIAAASLALDMVCMEWLGVTYGVVMVPPLNGDGKWSVGCDNDGQPPLPTRTFDTLTPAIHAAMEAVAEGKP